MRPNPRRFHLDPAVGFNATPLIDVIFTLTIFFMLVTRFSSAEHQPLQLPDPRDSRAQDSPLPDRVVVNCRKLDDRNPPGVAYSLGPNQPESLPVLAERIAFMARHRPDLKVVIRADRRLPYGDVHAVLKMLSAVGVNRLNVAAHLDQGR